MTTSHEDHVDEDYVRDFHWNEQACAAMMRRRGVFVRAYGWHVQWLHEATEYAPGIGHYAPYDAEDLHGFLLVRDDDYVCLPITDHEARHRYPKEGAVWVRNFLLPEIDVMDLGMGRHILGRGIDHEIDEQGDVRGCSIETVKLPAFQSAQAARDYLFACGTRRSNKVIDPIGALTASDTPAYRWWWRFNGQAWLGLPGAIPGCHQA